MLTKVKNRCAKTGFQLYTERKWMMWVKKRDYGPENQQNVK